MARAVPGWGLLACTMPQRALQNAVKIVVGSRDSLRTKSSSQGLSKKRNSAYFAIRSRGLPRSEATIARPPPSIVPQKHRRPIRLRARPKHQLLLSRVQSAMAAMSKFTRILQGPNPTCGVKYCKEAGVKNELSCFNYCSAERFTVLHDCRLRC